MEAYKITAELNLEKIIVESMEVAQALIDFAENLEQIEKKYAKSQENKEKDLDNLDAMLEDLWNDTESEVDNVTDNK